MNFMLNMYLLANLVTLCLLRVFRLQQPISNRQQLPEKISKNFGNTDITNHTVLSNLGMQKRIDHLVSSKESMLSEVNHSFFYKLSSKPLLKI